MSTESLLILDELSEELSAKPWTLLVDWNSFFLLFSCLGLLDFSDFFTASSSNFIFASSSSRHCYLNCCLSLCSSISYLMSSVDPQGSSTSASTFFLPAMVFYLSILTSCPGSRLYFLAFATTSTVKWNSLILCSVSLDCFRSDIWLCNWTAFCCSRDCLASSRSCLARCTFAYFACSESFV